MCFCHIPGLSIFSSFTVSIIGELTVEVVEFS